VWLVVGLGNPGETYADTRHNAGFMVVDRLAKAWGAKLRLKRHLPRLAEARFEGESVLLAEPQTFMNESGRAVREMVKGRRVPPERLLVCYDDLDLCLGEVRIRKAGGAGTHNGMRSVVAELGTTEFPRLRLGIGPVPEGRAAADFVLTRFLRAERPAFDAALGRAAEAVEAILLRGVERAMTDFNRRRCGSDSVPD